MFAHNLLARLFLAAVGLLYFGLAAYCTVAPARTSKAVGFELLPGSGQSEFLVIYGGLELALAILFLYPLYDPASLPYALLTCRILHAAICIFRTASFFLFAGVGGTTINLAIGEWVILVLSLLLSAEKTPQ